MNAGNAYTGSVASRAQADLPRANLVVVQLPLAAAMDMASRLLERRRLVQQLRKVAADAGAGQCRDDASRQKVQDMMGAIRGAGCPPGRLEEAEGIFKKFEATFSLTRSGAPDEAAAPADETTAGRDKFRLRGASFLLTYN